MFNPVDSVLGRDVVASVGELWDFQSEAGPNVLEGRVVQLSSPGEATPWLLCEVSPFAVGSIRVAAVGVVTRHSSELDLPRRVAGGESVGVNILYSDKDPRLTPETLRAALDSQVGLRFLAGSLRLLSPEG